MRVNFEKRLEAKQYLFIMIMYFLATPVYAQKRIDTSGYPRPKLVVGIIVDQMRWDYLYKYYDQFGNGGFKRLMNNGFRCENTYINYLPSATAVGHASIFTGSVPAIHGIAGNDWVEQLTGKHTYCTSDSTVNSVGTNSKAGEMSPHRLLVSTITDELRLATNFRSRVIGVSLKDRASILPTGHNPTAAFWFDDETGNFISSSFYLQNLPQWVNKFNKRNEGAKLTSKEWYTLYPKEHYQQSTKDDVPWEGLFDGENSPTFPHLISHRYQKNHGIIRSTPFGNTLTLDFAKSAIDAYELGAKNTTDFLTINCASTDYVGHMFGVNAIETEDTYLRLDIDLAAFFSHLDEKVGKGNYLVFLTADHGASHAIGFNKAYRMQAGFWDQNLFKQKLNQILKKRYNVANLVSSVVEYQVNFNILKIKKLKLDYSGIRRSVVTFLKDDPTILFAIDMNHIDETAIPDLIKTKIVNGYNYKRSGAVLVIPVAGFLQSKKHGTSHGEWNPYDTHVPLLFMGWHIPKGFTHRVYNTTDIAPTLAALLNIQPPNGCIGAPINDIFEN